jgi:iron(III) transport system substrate-binding protein
MNLRRIAVCALVTMFLISAFTAGAAEADPLKGRITLYTSQPDRDVTQLIAAFNEKHPGIGVDVFRSGTEEVVSKIRAEHRVRSVLADVLLVADSVSFENLKEEGMLLAYESPEVKGIPEEYLDKDRTYAGTKLITTGIIYNTTKVAEPPEAFADLAKEAFKNNLIMPSPLYSGAAAYNLGVMTRTEGLGWEFFEKLKENNTRVERGNGAILTAVAAGERSCGIIVDFMAVRARESGSPVEFVYPAEGSPAITEPIGILQTTRVPGLAKAFVDFVLSEEGQKLAAEMGYTPVKDGVEAPKGLKSVGEIKSMVYDIEVLKAAREAEKARFSAMFQ